MSQLLFLFFISFCVCHDSVQPQWNNNFDFDFVENQMQSHSITQLYNMRNYLSDNNKTAKFTNEVHIATLSNGWRTAFKPCDNDDIGDAIAEVSAYEASKKVGLGLVPPTVLKEYNGRIGSAQFFVDSPFDLLKPEDEKIAFSLIPEERKAAMYIFYYIFGQWDTHRGNQIVAYDEKTDEACLALIDNTAIRNRLQSRYGEHVYVKRLHHEGIKPYNGEPFPYDNPVILDLPMDAQEATAKLGGFPVSQQLLNRWVSFGMKQQACAIWSDALWLQFYRNSKTVPPNYTNVYPKDVMKSFKSLDLTSLQYIYRLGIEKNMDFCNERYFADILARRDEVMKAYKQSKKAL